MFFVMLRGVPYQTEEKLTERERLAVRHGTGRDAEKHAIALAVALAASIVVSRITDDSTVLLITFFGTWLVVYGLYVLFLGYSHNQIVTKLIATDVIFLGEHAEKYELFVRAIRAEIIRRDLNETTDEQIAEMMNHQGLYVEAVEDLDQTASDFGDKLAMNASNIIDAERHRKEGRNSEM